MTSSVQAIPGSSTGSQSHVPAMGLGVSAVVFGGAGILLFVVTHELIPRLGQITATEPIILWFLLGGMGVLAPLLLAALILLRREGPLTRPGVWTERLRCRPMTVGDWVWGLGSLAVSCGLMALLSLGGRAFLGTVELQPSFMELKPLTPGRYWMLAAWVPFWVLNIMGEEIAVFIVSDGGTTADFLAFMRANIAPDRRPREAPAVERIGRVRADRRRIAQMRQQFHELDERPWPAVSQN